MNANDLFRLVGKVALVTGGAGIVGSLISEALAEAGATVVLASRSRDKCEEKANALRSKGLDAYGMKLDLSSEDEIVGLRDTLLQRWKTIDILFNNAVARAGEGFDTMTKSEWEDVLGVNATGLFLSSKIFGSEMAKRRYGSIVNISSIYGAVGPDFRIYEGTDIKRCPANYSFTKAGMIGFTKYLATYFAEHNVRVNCIYFGGVYSGQSQAFANNYSQRCPLGRMAEPDDVKGAALFFASDASRYVTGQILGVDGGWTAW